MDTTHLLAIGNYLLLEMFFHGFLLSTSHQSGWGFVSIREGKSLDKRRDLPPPFVDRNPAHQLLTRTLNYRECERLRVLTVNQVLVPITEGSNPGSGRRNFSHRPSQQSSLSRRNWQRFPPDRHLRNERYRSKCIPRDARSATHSCCITRSRYSPLMLNRVPALRTLRREIMVHSNLFSLDNVTYEYKSCGWVGSCARIFNARWILWKTFIAITTFSDA